jgi:hypothetical protein
VLHSKSRYSGHYHQTLDSKDINIEALVVNLIPKTKKVKKLLLFQMISFISRNKDEKLLHPIPALRTV